jgi:[ribosomal protein S5]-alanine N-acetyltransferase
MMLRSSRLYLRPFSPSDINETYLKALNDPSVMGLTEARHQIWDRSKAVDFIELASSKGSKIFGVFLKDSDKAIGNIRIFNIHDIHRRAELSFLIYDKNEWSRGYASEAIDALLVYAFDELNLHRIVADYYASNAASARLFDKLGFVVEGIFKEHFAMENGEFMDSIRVAKLSKKN